MLDIIKDAHVLYAHAGREARKKCSGCIGNTVQLKIYWKLFISN